MSDCTIESYGIFIAGLGFILLAGYAYFRDYNIGQENYELNELRRLRQLYKPEAEKQEREQARLQELEKRYIHNLPN